MGLLALDLLLWEILVEQDVKVQVELAGDLGDIDGTEVGVDRDEIAKDRVDGGVVELVPARRLEGRKPADGHEGRVPD